jgi:hypothetical protein
MLLTGDGDSSQKVPASSATPMISATEPRAQDYPDTGHGRSTLAFSRGMRIGNEKRRWDMPTSRSNPVLETWTHADLAVRSSISKLQQCASGDTQSSRPKEAHDNPVYHVFTREVARASSRQIQRNRFNRIWFELSGTPFTLRAGVSDLMSCDSIRSISFLSSVSATRFVRRSSDIQRVRLASCSSENR